MEFNINRLKESWQKFNKIIKNEENVIVIDEKHVDSIFQYLSEKILDTNYTEAIAECFTENLLILTTLAIPINEKNENSYSYRKKCIALSKLLRKSVEILRYAIKFFTKHQAPFKENELVHVPAKKTKLSETDLDIVKCCYNFLAASPSFFRNIWDWSEFVKLYSDKGCTLQKLYFNRIVAILGNLNENELKIINKGIDNKILIDFNSKDSKDQQFNLKSDFSQINLAKKVKWDLIAKTITNIEGITLPIYNTSNEEFYRKTDGNYERLVMVDSTKANLRNISLGISSGKTVCLSGPVGCGKTTLVEYLARKTGRIVPKLLEYQRFYDIDSGRNTQNSEKIDGNINQEDLDQRNGFLRIQLGDQTDSKMLLGQYRCTDIPGEFIWLPGPLTQAVMKGFWLLLEDLDLASQDTCTILCNLLEKNMLSVVGFRERIKVNPDFQLFVTIRTRKSLNNSQKAVFFLLEKYLHITNIHPLSYSELCQVVEINYPKLKTISSRIVDVYLMFSSGDHYDTNLFDTHNTNGHINCYESNKNSELDSETNVSKFVKSGRLVSTRDLVKLCNRCNLSFLVTSTESAEFVFQNAVDIFCSHIPQSSIKTKLIISIGKKLGIIPSRCEYFSNDYKPDIKIYADVLNIGRAKLCNEAEDVEYGHVNKKLRLISNKEKNIYEVSNTKVRITFSHTRIASCLLERIAVALLNNEPILLVGETGSGKTSSVQYLAHQTGHNLVVLNMNNQSDISDLVGGFRPVDLSYLITPLRSEFEQLFRKTFNECKNEQFLSNLSICFNQGNFLTLVQIMNRVIENVFTVKQRDLIARNRKDLLDNWRTLQSKVLKLSCQMKNSINISFAFISGSLINCIKNGDWILLDEINLASAETLECLSTILEPDGSLVLLEKGDLSPVKRHPNFRLFACMNPSTDIGKKDLPVGIRNRFTEYFVDELTSENDLMVLVSDYLTNTGIARLKVLHIVKLYQKLRSLSQLALNDGLGNRPVFSLRTLCRSLTICARNLCGSIERNLFESFCVSFLSQLDPISHVSVLELISKTILSNNKAVLSQPIPKPNGNYINFEGYWIQKGTLDIEDCPEYILTESVKRNLKDISRIISIGKLPILLQGHTSSGKTSLIGYIAKRSGNYCLRVNNHEHTDIQEYVGTYMSDTTGKLVFKEGILVQAMRKGYWIILDELNLASTEILEALNRVLDDNRELFIPETQTLVKAHPNFMLFATQNPPGLYGGRKTLSRAFKNRFVELHFPEIPKTELEIILEKRCLIPKSYAYKMVNVMTELQLNRISTTRNTFTLRDLFRWGKRYTLADKKLLENHLYDWNQHLVDEGYLVLSAKVRNQAESNIIEVALFKYFRKKPESANLFSLHKNTSAVTKDILEYINNYDKRKDIVWTQNMTRTAVLTAKALKFDEPVLLIGPTGAAKTTVCQILADINQTNLRILNCHMHTEGADFLGGLRPCRNNSKMNENGEKQLFEWVDGPLVLSMREGSFFLADEISLAEDSVLERLNCVLESERTLLLAERGGIDNDINITSLADTDEFVVNAKTGFQFLATMNPGGDFGKKELSAALRNRFTEIWCKPSNEQADLTEILANFLNFGLRRKTEHNLTDIATVLVRIVFYLRSLVEKFQFSIRDILSWANYIIENTNYHKLNLSEALVFGLDIVFLDSLEMLPYESIGSVNHVRNLVLQYTKNEIKNCLKLELSLKYFENKEIQLVERRECEFGISPFFITINLRDADNDSEFFFNAPTTKKNLLSLLSALSLNKSILLEGPPGVGKTSLVESLASELGNKMIRINLSEHTDLIDLFGTDLPAEDRSLEIDEEEDQKGTTPPRGSFVWCDGPLLAALKAKNTWILLDELNLAPQSVLEGLNAILDHRGEVFIPELNKTFHLGVQTRIFACQNPLRQGGGRKGLPQSFLNRFTKVYLKNLSTDDLFFVVNKKYYKYFNELKSYFGQFLKFIQSESEYVNLFEINNVLNQMELSQNEQSQNIEFDLARRLVQFTSVLDKAINNFEFGFKGGPYEVNLRDILRWCELLQNANTGFLLSKVNFTRENSLSIFRKIFSEFLLVLYERMKLVYYQRMQSDNDKKFIQQTFSDIFCCDAELLNTKCEDVGLYWTDSAIYLNDIVIDRCKNSIENDNLQEIAPILKDRFLTPIILPSQRELLKNMMESIHINKPVILSGPADSGKTKMIDTLCMTLNQFCDVDIIDDSVIGSFQQVNLYRHLEEITLKVESIIVSLIKNTFLWNKSSSRLLSLQDVLKCWWLYINIIENEDCSSLSAMSDEFILFKRRIELLNETVEKICAISEFSSCDKTIKSIQAVLRNLKNITQNSDSLNTGGHFEWIDSKIVKCLRRGHYICLEHVNMCSSAVLDRLNSVFEPNGSILIAERGISSGKEAEVIKKHSNFQAFLTLDPKNGDLSRAMRNRCVELAITKEMYTQNDMKQILFWNGIIDDDLIETVLIIHQRINALNERNQYNISQLLQLAFLVSSNLNYGLDNIESLRNSAMEVYVYSINSDLICSEYDTMKNEMKGIINEESSRLNKLKTTEIISNISNSIITCDNLSEIKMIQLQSEPFRILFNLHNNTKSSKKALVSIFDEYSQLEFVNNLDFLKWCLYILYELSSLSDVNLRHKYIMEIIFSQNSDVPVSVKAYLSSMNDELFKHVEDFKKLIDPNLYSLPWNKLMFERIRHYKTTELSKYNDLSLSLSLLCNATFEDKIQLNKNVKLKEMTLFEYSHLVYKNMLADNYRNPILSYLSTMIDNLKQSLRLNLKYTNIHCEKYTDLVISLLWINRIENCSQQKLLLNDELNMAAIDKLILHFRWLDKHLIIRLHEIIGDNFFEDAALNNIKNVQDFIGAAQQPFEVNQKMYMKRIVNFAPLYNQIEIDLSQIEIDFRNRCNLIPLYGAIEHHDLIKRFKIIFSNEAEQIKDILKKNYKNRLESLTCIDLGSLNVSILLPDNLRKAIKVFSENLSVLNNDKFHTNYHRIYNLKENVGNLENVINNNMNISINDIGLLAIKEYFINKFLTIVPLNKSKNLLKNDQFFNTTPTIDINTIQLAEILNEKNYRIFENLWAILTEHMDSINEIEKFKHILDTLSISNYRNLSTFSRTIMNYYQSAILNNFSRRNDIYSKFLEGDDIDADYEYNGSPLSMSVLHFIFKTNGIIKTIELGKLNSWKTQLSNVGQILWGNMILMGKEFDFEDANLGISLSHSNKVLLDVQYINEEIKNCKPSEFSNNFKQLVEKLKSEREKTQNEIQIIKHLDNKFIQKLLKTYRSSMLNSIMGVIEMCLFTYTPLIDPVEKVLLKNKYISDDVAHLKKLSTIYDLMKIILQYQNFGREITENLKNKILSIDKKILKFRKKIAVRPTHSLYRKLVYDIKHFAQNICSPKVILVLLTEVENYMSYISSEGEFKMNFLKIEQFDAQIRETIKKINLWIAYGRTFLYSTLKTYSIYYQDFIRPVECALIMIIFGLDGLKCCLEQLRKSFYDQKTHVLNIHQNSSLFQCIHNVIEFPSTEFLRITCDYTKSTSLGGQYNLGLILQNIEGGKSVYLTLVNAKLLEIKNRLIISKHMNTKVFNEFMQILTIVNKIWQDEEEERKKRTREEESLYVKKTYCKDVDEDIEDQEEIDENFPTYVDEFNEFFIEDNLNESTKKLVSQKVTGAVTTELIDEENITFFGKHFVHIMEEFTGLYYCKSHSKEKAFRNLDFVQSFYLRIKGFTKIVNNYKTCLNSELDDIGYIAYGFLFGLQQEKLKIAETIDSKVYNFYKDGNISEILPCIEVMEEIEKRVQTQLDLYPDHAVLLDIQKVIEKIRSIDSTAPVVRFNAGFQILRQKVSQWNEVAHKNNNLLDLESKVAEHVQRWTRLELNFWRNCLTNAFEKVENAAYKYWFFLYELVNEYLQNNLVISKYVESFRSDDNNITDLKADCPPEVQESHLIDLIMVLKQFMNISNYADFNIRLKLLKSFEMYLHNVKICSNQKDDLIAVFHNLYIYYMQFTKEVEECVTTIRAPIEKKLRDLVKIESYNKDLSYFSMRNNVARVHRNLNKILKEYTKLLKESIMPIFKKQKHSIGEYNLGNDKGINLRYEPKITYYMMSSKNFIVPRKQLEKLQNELHLFSKLNLLSKLDKLFETSRNIVKESIDGAQYPNLIHSLDLLLTEQIERAEELKKIEIIRNQDKEKQKIQAKQILSQKRRALSNIFKILTTLGISYKAGLMENTMNSDHVNYVINPFCIKTMFSNSKYKKFDQNMVHLNEKIHNYYAKSILKLNMLLNTLLTANADLDAPTTDRIKGFSVDLFLLVQNQRKKLSTTLKSLYDLRQLLCSIKQLEQCIEDIRDKNNGTEESSFNMQKYKVQNIKDNLIKIRYVFEQFRLLLKYMPEEEKAEFRVFAGESSNTLYRSSEKFTNIFVKVNKILAKTINDYAEVDKCLEMEFIKLSKISTIESNLKEILYEISDLKEEFSIGNGSYMVLANCISSLLQELSHEENINLCFANQNTETSEIESVDEEIQSIIHSILLSIQRIYKKHSKERNEAVDDIEKENSFGNHTLENVKVILEKHLKEQLYKQLNADFESMNASTINKKLSNIIDLVRNSTNYDMKLECIRKISFIQPMVEQYNLLIEYLLLQQLGAHKISVKMLTIMLTVFVELSVSGFCIPQDLMQDEEGEQKDNKEQNGECFGFEDGAGENDVSDKIESEDQLDDAKRPEDRKNENNQNENEKCKEEKGIEMSENFDADMQSLDGKEDESGDEEKSDTELDKEMGETEENTEKLDDQIWGSDEESENEEDDNLNKEEDGKGSNQENEQHEDLSSKDTKQAEGLEDDGLDATNKDKSNEEKNQKQNQKNDIDELKDPEVDEDQINPYHNDLEEPPEAEDMNLDNNMQIDDQEKDANENNENPFDIDKLKENLITEEECAEENLDQENDLENNKENNNDNIDSNSESETEDPEYGTKNAENELGKEENDDKTEEVDLANPKDESVIEEEANNEEQLDGDVPDQDKSICDTEDIAENSTDQKPETVNNDTAKNNVASSTTDTNIDQSKDVDTLDSGEDQLGTGVSKNDVSKEGRKKSSKSEQEKSSLPESSAEKKTPGKTNEERTLGESESEQIKSRQKLHESQDEDNDDEKNDDAEKLNTDECKHVKNAEKDDKVAYDAATEEQAKTIQHQEDSQNEEPQEDVEMECNNDLDDDEIEENLRGEDDQQKETLKSEPTNTKSTKNDKNKEQFGGAEAMEMEGDLVDTSFVSRPSDTTAHFSKEIVCDLNNTNDTTEDGNLNFRQLYQEQSIQGQMITPQEDDYSLWKNISNKMLTSARELCEQLRLILEPTKCTRLKGDYRTGKRLNMKKIVPYIASQFRKDKIWLRRMKPSQRDYKITIAIDDSKSMHHNNSKTLTLEAISLVSQALTLLESGKLSVVSFGETPQLILNHTDWFDGAKLAKSLNFEQNQSKIAELLDYIRAMHTEQGLSSNNGIFENLLLVLSDGRNIFSEGEAKVKNAIKLARLQRVFLVYIIIDNPENKHSILDVQVPHFSEDRKKIVMAAYLHSFPFPYYVIVRDLAQLPVVLSEAMRQWFELVNSEQ